MLARNTRYADAASIISSAIGQFVDRVSLETSVTAPSDLYVSGQPVSSGGGGGGMLDVGSILAPKVSIYLHGNAEPIEIAPYGEPSSSKWVVPAVMAALFLAGWYVGSRRRK